MSSGNIAVIDIGSNSIKTLVATRSPEGKVIGLKTQTLDARISRGISQRLPRLDEAGMTAGISAIEALLAETAPFSPDKTILVATSAVRDAVNGHEFRERVRTVTGHAIRILTGEEEASLIGAGLTCDPALEHLRDFYVVDLGGGSLEALAFRDRRIFQAVSLPLGCVRLTERFIADSRAALTAAARGEIDQCVRTALGTSPFTFSLPASALLVGTGGTITTVRAIIGAAAGMALEEVAPIVTVTQLRDQLATLAALALPERQQINGLPPARADVFPTALVTLIAVAEMADRPAWHHSMFNLRYGVAAQALNAP